MNLITLLLSLSFARTASFDNIPHPAWVEFSIIVDVSAGERLDEALPDKILDSAVPLFDPEKSYLVLVNVLASGVCVARFLRKNQRLYSSAIQYADQDLSAFNFDNHTVKLSFQTYPGFKVGTVHAAVLTRTSSK